MKKKGFTLVELLAVIVILAVIALIAVPTILGVIDKAKRSSLQDSGYGLVEAANLYYAQYQNSKTVRFDIENNKITTEEENKLNYKGIIKNGAVLINNKGQVTVCINDGKHAAYKNYQDSKVIVVDSKTCTVPENKYVVYLDDEATIIEMTNQELTEEIENLKTEISNLKEEKSNITDVTNAINNLNNTHNSDITLLNNKLGTTNISNIGNGTITGSINSLNNDIISLNSQLTSKTTSTNLINYLDGILYEKVIFDSKMWVIQGYVNQTLPSGGWYYIGIVDNKPINDCAIITITSSGNPVEARVYSDGTVKIYTYANLSVGEWIRVIIEDYN